MTASTTVLAAQAAAQAREACALAVVGYKHDGATVQQAQAYAGCVEQLYPQPFLTENGLIVAKCAVVLALVIMVICAWKYVEDEGVSLESVFMGIGVGGMMGCAVLLLIALLYGAVSLLLL